MTNHTKKSIAIAGAAIAAVFGGIALLDREQKWTDWVAGILLGSFVIAWAYFWNQDAKRSR